jgi:hypothetical protein
VGPKKVKQMTIRQLIEHFDPEEPNNEIGKRIQGIVGDSPCIVFDQPGSRTIDVDATFGLIDELKRGYPARPIAKGESWAIVDVRGITKPAYKVGFIPENYASENPLYVGRPLRPDGTCDQTNRSWSGVPLEIRQFIRVGLNQGEIKISRIEDAHSMLDIALMPDAFDILSKRYQQTRVKFDSLKAKNKLPDLQILLTQTNKTQPFDGGSPVSWSIPISPNLNNNFYYSTSDNSKPWISKPWIKY